MGIYSIKHLICPTKTLSRLQQECREMLLGPEIDEPRPVWSTDAISQSYMMRVHSNTDMHRCACYSISAACPHMAIIDCRLMPNVTPTCLQCLNSDVYDLAEGSCTFRSLQLSKVMTDVHMIANVMNSRKYLATVPIRVPKRRNVLQ